MLPVSKIDKRLRLREFRTISQSIYFVSYLTCIKLYTFDNISSEVAKGAGNQQPTTCLPQQRKNVFTCYARVQDR